MNKLKIFLVIGLATSNLIAMEQETQTRKTKKKKK